MWTFAALVAGTFFLQAPAVGASEKEFRDEVEPLLAKYCYDCHGEGASKGDVELDAFADYTSLTRQALGSAFETCTPAPCRLPENYNRRTCTARPLWVGSSGPFSNSTQAF